MKMNKKRPILRRAAIPAVLALLCTLFWFGKPNDFGLGRNMELLVNMMRELSLFYVDEVDPDQLMQDAAEGMTRNLDPYTEFLPEEQMSNFDLLTTGKYGGIGSMIRKKGDYVIFAQPYEGSPADRAGIRIGDKILSIEGEDTKGWDPAQISSALKGTPNTTVRIVIERLIGGARSRTDSQASSAHESSILVDAIGRRQTGRERRRFLLFCIFDFVVSVIVWVLNCASCLQSIHIKAPRFYAAPIGGPTSAAR